MPRPGSNNRSSPASDRVRLVPIARKALDPSLASNALIRRAALM